MLLFEALAISAAELALIVAIYTYWIIPAIERRVIDKWLEEVNSGALDLTLLLADVTDDAAKKVYSIIKNQLLAGSGNLAKVLANPAGDPDLQALSIGENMLRDLGLKNPSALMVFKLLKSLSGGAGVLPGVTDSSEPPASQPVGTDIFSR